MDRQAVDFNIEPPSTYHQDIVSGLTWAIQNYIRGNKGGCKVFPAPFAVYISNDKYNYVEPDVTVVCDKDRLDDRGCHGAPDWVIEVLSPSSVWLDCVIKLQKYNTSGVRLYWIINPDRKQVTVYDFENQTSDVYGFDEDIPVSIYPGFSIRMDQLILD